MKNCLLSLILALSAATAQASPESEMLTLNMKDRSWSEELQFMQEFAVSSEAACKTWSPQAFRVQKNLAEACQFAPLLKRYLRKLKALPNSEATGVVIPQVQFTEATVAVLQSGAWQTLVLSEKNGFQSALELVFLRIALQKSLVAQANLIRQQDPEHFNSFAAMVIPRMQSALSSYSQTLQRLVFIDSFQCGAITTKACLDSKSVLKNLRGQIALGIGDKDFFAGLSNMDEANSSVDLLKVQHAKNVIRQLAKMKAEKSLQQILSMIDGKSTDPLFSSLRQELAAINGNGLTASTVQQTHMLVAVSMLAEITELQSRTAGFVPGSGMKAGLQAKKTTEEMNRLKSLALAVLRQTEEVE